MVKSPRCLAVEALMVRMKDWICKHLKDPIFAGRAAVRSLSSLSVCRRLFAFITFVSGC